MRIARVALPVAAHALFDYWIPEGLEVARGQLVRVRLARRALVGVVAELAGATDVPRDKLQPVVEIVAAIPPLPSDGLTLAEFVARYYQEPLGLVLTQMVPRAASLRQPPAEARALRLTAEGRAALARRVARAGAARGLHDRLVAAEGATLALDAIAALSAG